MIWMYKIGVYLVAVLCLPVVPLVWLWSPKRRANLLPRFGFQAVAQKKSGRKRVWIHALSVGEVTSALPFVRRFRQRFDRWEIVFSASTKTGYETARALYLDDRPMIDHLCYFPFDIGASVRRTAAKVRPDLVILVETDLWPTFLYEMQRQAIPVVLINARLSSRSFNGYAACKRAGLAFYRYLDAIMAQSGIDRERFETLGFPADRIHTPGNIKFDQPRADADASFLATYRALLGIDDKTKVWIAGSTHRGEEEILLAVLKTLEQTVPEIKLILAPRDPGRSRSIHRQYESAGIQVDLLSQLDAGHPGGRVIIVDTLGLLSKLYALCDLAFVGGSMVARGGHNPLEPAAFGKPVLFGKDMSDFSDISQALVDTGAAFRADTPQALAKTVARLLSDTDRRQGAGRSAERFFLEHKGAVDRILDTLHNERYV